MLTQGVLLCVLYLLRYHLVSILFGPLKKQLNERVNYIHLECLKPQSLVDLHVT